MIPIGTPCYIVRSEYPDAVGRVVTITAHRKCTDERTLADCAECPGVCYCVTGETVCQASNDDFEWCFDDFRSLRPITPPASDVDTTTPRELVTA